MARKQDLGRLLKDSKNRLRLAIRAAGIGIFEIDVSRQEVRYSRELAEMLGFPTIRRTELAGAFARIHRDDIARVVALYEAALSPAGSGRLLMQFRFVRPGGEVRWMTWNGKVEFRQEEGRRVASRIVGACSDITEAKRAEQAARDREIFLANIMDSLPQHVCVLDRAGIVKAVNRPWVRFAQENGATLESVGAGVDYLDVCRRGGESGDTHAKAALDGLRSLMASTAKTFELEYPCHGPDIQRWFVLFASRSIDAADIIVSHFDVTQRKLAEENVRHLMREINHRGKNMLSLVQAIARQTAATSGEGFLTRFTQRIDALAASQDQLVREGWESVALSDLIRAQLAHFEELIATRVIVEGPPVKLTAGAAQTIGMAIHELATNAAKYGALSSEMGRIRISWALGGGSGESPLQLELTWIERGGPDSANGGKRGFGTTLIEQIPRTALGAHVTLAYPPSGCEWRLVCEVARLSPAEGVSGNGDAPGS